MLGDGPLPQRTVMVASLAKAFSAGGAVLVFPDAETARLVRAFGSTLIFSGPLQPALLGAAIASARVHLSSEINTRQRRLMDRIRLFNDLAAARGLPLGSTGRDADPLRQDGRQRRHLPDRRRADGATASTCNTAVFPAVSNGHGGLRVALTAPGARSTWPATRTQPPYSSVLAAMRDGWRVIQCRSCGPAAAGRRTRDRASSNTSSCSRRWWRSSRGATAPRLTSLQVAAFVADGALRFDGIVPRALSDAALAELAGGGPPSPFGADPAAPPPGGPGARWPGCSATGPRSPRCWSCPRSPA